MAVLVESHPTLGEAQRALGSDGTYLGGGTLVMRDVNAGAIQGRVVRTSDPALRREWRRRLALKMWAGWPTFPMVFVKGVLVGGATDLEKLVASGELKEMVEGV